MTAYQPTEADQPRRIRVFPNAPTSPFRFFEELFQSVPSSEQVLRHPEGRTASTDRGEDDDWSEENMRRWERTDKLDPELAEWLRTLPRK